LQEEVNMLYQKLLEKESQSILSLNNFYINVSYFNGPTSITYKQKLFSVATYQYISYYLDILSGVNSHTNLSFNPASLVPGYTDNVLYIFKNANEIS
jgi:hypothetical protein